MNYVMFFTDEMRAENLGCYGHPIARTPNYDRLAAGGTLFENHYVQNPVCVGSRCSLLTGWYPHVGGFRSLLNFLTPNDPNFLRYLKNAGYQVVLLGKNHVLDEDALADSVSLYDSCGGSRTEQGSLWKDTGNKNSRKGNHLFSGDYTMLFPPMEDSELENMQDTKTVQRGIEFIQQWTEDDPPFFLFISINHPHAPYVCTRHYQEMYDPADFRLRTATEGRQPSFVHWLRTYSGFEEMDEKVFQRCAAVYQGMISYCDDMLGRVLDTLEKCGLEDKTMVVATSDHGDFAGDYGLVEKWPNCFYDDLAKTPLIIRGPGIQGGNRISQLVSQIDIFPTILDYAKVQAGHDHFGHSLRQFLEGGAQSVHADGRRTAGSDESDAGEGGVPADITGEPAVFCEGGYDLREPQCFEGTERDYSFLLREDCVYYPKMMIQQEHGECVCRGTMMRCKNYKLIVRSNGENEFFDLSTDQYEEQNLYEKEEWKALIQQMEKEMLMWYIRTSDAVRPLR